MARAGAQLRLWSSCQARGFASAAVPTKAAPQTTIAIDAQREMRNMIAPKKTEINFPRAFMVSYMAACELGYIPRRQQFPEVSLFGHSLQPSRWFVELKAISSARRARKAGLYLPFGSKRAIGRPCRMTFHRSCDCRSVSGMAGHSPYSEILARKSIRARTEPALSQLLALRIGVPLFCPNSSRRGSTRSPDVETRRNVAVSAAREQRPVIVEREPDQCRLLAKSGSASRRGESPPLVVEGGYRCFEAAARPLADFFHNI